MTKQDGKIKTFVEEHKYEIKRKATKAGVCAVGAIGVGAGYFVRGKVDVCKFAIWMGSCCAKGLIKLCDPETGLEVSPEEFCKILKKY